MLSTHPDFKHQGRFVKPEVYSIGFQVIDNEGLNRYLQDSGNEDFAESMRAAREKGVSDAEIICSMYSKLCYRALTLGKNANVTRVRDIPDNFIGTLGQAHGSVFEHVNFNFIIADCSRVLTHELVRHRIGVAFSQTSGRYCRLDRIPLVWDPILDPVQDLWDEHLQRTDDLIYLSECKLGLRKPPPDKPFVLSSDVINAYTTCQTATGVDYCESLRWVPDESLPFHVRKKITSALRRIAPNGQANEIGFSVNLRSLRHTILMRTASVAEWEIRSVFGEIYRQTKAKYPLVFHDAKERMVEGLLEVYGMKMQPYEQSAKMVLDEMTDDEVALYLRTRPKAAQQVAEWHQIAT